MSGPIPSPTPDVPPPSDKEPQTDPGALVTVGDMKHSNLVNRIIIGAMAFVFSGGAGSCGVVTTLGLIRAEARAQAKEEVTNLDAGLKGVIAEASALKSRVQTLEQRFERYEAKQDRQDQKIDLVLDAMRVPKDVRPPPVPPLDAGVRFPP